MGSKGSKKKQLPEWLEPKPIGTISCIFCSREIKYDKVKLRQWGYFLHNKKLARDVGGPYISYRSFTAEEKKQSGFYGIMHRTLDPLRDPIWEDRHGAYRCFASDCCGIKEGYSEPSTWEYQEDERYLGYYVACAPDWRPGAPKFVNGVEPPDLTAWMLEKQVKEAIELPSLIPPGVELKPTAYVLANLSSDHGTIVEER